MILADTSIWIDHFRSRKQIFLELMRKRVIVTHPYVIGELALGTLHNRSVAPSPLDRLPSLRVAQQSEVRRMIEARSLHGNGIGVVDAHLLASVLIHQPARIWTTDKRLMLGAINLGIDANLGIGTGA